jgi:hypothetical protein
MLGYLMYFTVSMLVRRSLLELSAFCKKQTSILIVLGMLAKEKVKLGNY